MKDFENDPYRPFIPPDLYQRVIIDGMNHPTYLRAERVLNRVEPILLRDPNVKSLGISIAPVEMEDGAHYAIRVNYMGNPEGLPYSIHGVPLKYNVIPQE